jgi:5'-3' exonuclease
MNTHPLPEPGAPDALYLLDLSSWARAFYEMARHLTRTNPKAPDPDAPDHVGVAHSVARRLIDDVIVARKPAFLGIALDVIGERPARADIWDGYKIGRNPPGPGYARQVGILLEVFLAHRIPCFQSSGLEADDFVATLTRRARRAGLRVVNLTADQDLWQLFETADPAGVLSWDVGKGQVWSAEDCLKKYGVPPEQLADAMALAGDGDEAPGIKGIGVDKAAKLLRRHGNLETVLLRWQWERGKLSTNLRDGAEDARMSKRLVALDDRAPIVCPLQALALGWSEEDARAIARLGVKYGLGVLGYVKPGAYPKAIVDPALEARWAGAATTSASNAATAEVELPPLPERDPVEQQEPLAHEALAGDGPTSAMSMGEPVVEDDEDKVDPLTEDLDENDPGVGDCSHRRRARERFSAVLRAAESDNPEANKALERLRNHRIALFDAHVAKVRVRCPTEEKLKAACRARFAELRPDLPPVFLLAEVRFSLERLAVDAPLDGSGALSAGSADEALDPAAPASAPEEASGTPSAGSADAPPAPGRCADPTCFIHDGERCARGQMRPVDCPMAAALFAAGWRSMLTWPTAEEEDATPVNRWSLVEGRWAELVREGAAPEAALLYVLRSEYDEEAATTEGRMHKPRSLVRVFWRGTTEDVEIPNRLVARYLQFGEPVPDPALPILPVKRPRVVGTPAPAHYADADRRGAGARARAILAGHSVACAEFGNDPACRAADPAPSPTAVTPSPASTATAEALHGRTRHGNTGAKAPPPDDQLAMFGRPR